MSTTAASEESPLTVNPRPHRKRTFQWVPTDAEQLELAERRMLSTIADCYQQERIAGLNTIYFKSEQHSRTLVLLHGFAGGVGNWVPNWRELVKHTNVYAIDLPGFARSMREDLKFSSECVAIDYMMDCISSWVQQANLPPVFDIAGHSFGAYLAAQFAVKYPNMISRLVLADPWGVPKKPENIEKEYPFKWRMALKAFYVGNPLSILRASGPWGPGLLPKYRPDFAERWTPIVEDPNIFFDYTYHCNAHEVPTGERAFQACCTGPAYARRPLIDTLLALPTSIKLAVIYGKHTWMDKKAGQQVVADFQNKGGPAHLALVSEAGHQVNSDNAKEFNEVLLQALDLEPL
jgi:abhydrolase domain-containing protein 4